MGLGEVVHGPWRGGSWALARWFIGLDEVVHGPWRGGSWALARGLPRSSRGFSEPAAPLNFGLAPPPAK